MAKQVGQHYVNFRVLFSCEILQANEFNSFSLFVMRNTLNVRTISEFWTEQYYFSEIVYYLSNVDYTKLNCVFNRAFLRWKSGNFLRVFHNICLSGCDFEAFSTRNTSICGTHSVWPGREICLQYCYHPRAFNRDILSHPREFANLFLKKF